MSQDVARHDATSLAQPRYRSRMRIALLFVAIAGCGPGPHSSTPPASSAPEATWSGWWEVDDVDSAGVLGGAAIRLGRDPAYVVMPTIPAFEVCQVAIAGMHVTITGIGQDASAVVATDQLRFDGGFAARRASPARAAELDRIIPEVQAACDRARTCYRAAVVVLGIENQESKDFGPLLRTDACNNVITNLLDDLQSASKAIPAACTVVGDAGEFRTR
jgi:hypothetical protein